MKKIMLIIISMMLIMSIAINISAEETAADNNETNDVGNDCCENSNDNQGPLTVYTVQISTDGDLEAYFNGQADGDLTYYIDGLLVDIEFDSVWNALTNLLKKIDNTNLLANNALNQANNAFNYADQAFSFANDNGKKINNHQEVLTVHYDALCDHSEKITYVNNELYAFEGAYLEFTNETNSTLASHDNHLMNHETELDLLKAKINDLNATILLLRNCLVGFGLIAGCLYIINRRYPFKDMINNTGIDRNPERKYKIVDFKKPAEAKRSSSKIKMPTIRKSPKKSPLRFLFSFFHINK